MRDHRGAPIPEERSSGRAARCPMGPAVPSDLRRLSWARLRHEEDTMSDLRPDADVVQMAADILPQLDEIEALANNRGWPIGPNGQMVKMAAGFFRDLLATYAKERPSRHVALERRGDWIVTRSGKRFWPMDPRPDEFEVDD